MMRSMGRYGDEEQRGRLALILRRDYLLGALALLVLGVFIGALTFIPALALGPVVEHLQLTAR